MTYRSILVMLDHDTDNDARVHAASGLAARLDCHLVGLAPTGTVVLPIAPGAERAVAELGMHAVRELQFAAQQRVERFLEHCRFVGLRSYEALVDEADKAQSVVHHAHCSDLTIVSQAEVATPHGRQTQEFLDEVVLASARPTLVLPRRMSFDRPGERILVAWDDSREAARAVNDALPILREAQDVQVVCWNEKGLADDRHLHLNLDALRNWLSWHGVTAEVLVADTDGRISDDIIARVIEQRADLLVMGAYGHSRWSEVMLGGATRGLMQRMTVPVLMSH